ncbi:hypothetical protein MAJ_07235, partial [Metarhizium majus ARSEF 297]
MTGKKKTKGKSRKNPSGNSTLCAANDQESSWFFQLPQELRISIYGYLFLSTRVSHGRRPVRRIAEIRITPAPHSLALLRTCRRVRTEIGDSWLGQVLFSFEDTETMMVKLTALSTATLSKIRHLRIRGETLMLSFGDEDVYYRLVHILKLLPGLQLDTFTVLNMYGESVSYDVLNTLIKYGEGWKELRFISHGSSLLGYAQPPDIFNDEHFNERYQRKPQPAHWVSAMNSRDGIENQPSVTIYRSTLAGEACSVINEATRVLFEQTPPGKGKAAAFATQEYAPIMSRGEKAKELMVVVKRGKGVHYQERKQSPYLPVIGDIRKDCPRMTWAEIQKKYIDCEVDDGFVFSDDADDGPKSVDIYEHVDEYEWTPLNFDANA